ncbi:MAG: FAD-dependent monooxygenase [Gemmatimonadota bacterium]
MGLGERDPSLVEWMDRGDCDAAKLRATYMDFRHVNRWIANWPGVYRKHIHPLLKDPAQPYSLLDVGCGGGDLARLLNRLAAEDGFLLEVVGVDPDPRAIAFAGGENRLGVDFRQATAHDLVQEGRQFDFVITNHVLHHLDTEAVQPFLEDLAALSRKRVICSDIRRSSVAYVLYHLATLPVLLRKGYIREDGLLSIRRSFTVPELRELTPKGWRVEGEHPFRILALCDTPEASKRHVRDPAGGAATASPNAQRDAGLNAGRSAGPDVEPAAGNSPGEANCDLVVVGGGPVGLLAGVVAAHLGLTCVVLERSRRVVGESVTDRDLAHRSRAIGIHPPALRILDWLGLGDAFQAAGIAIPGGSALGDAGRKLGTMDFGSLPAGSRHVLALPQHRTERLLLDAMEDLNPGGYRPGVEVEQVTPLPRQSGMLVEARTCEGTPLRLAAAFVLACDGKRSGLRRQAGIPFPGGTYPERYVMGDFPDSTEHGPQAAIYVTRGGLVESFPLEAGVRRWVAQEDRLGDPQAGSAPHAPPLDRLLAAVAERCHVTLRPDECRMVSAFPVECYLAGTFWRDRLLLAGDAAHVVSPIGGQGMNLGWIHALEAVQAVKTALRHPEQLDEQRRRYNRKVRLRAREAQRRAEQNMFLGNRRRMPALRELAIATILASPLARVAARRFTMHGLKPELEPEGESPPPWAPGKVSAGRGAAR